MTDAELGLLGHLIGDGCTLPSHAIQYTTREFDLAKEVVSLATKVFGETLCPYFQRTRTELVSSFPATAQHPTHGVRNPVRVWLEELGVFGLRSHESFCAGKSVFQQPKQAVARFLRHLWATDGHVSLRIDAKNYPAVFYATSSELLAEHVS